MADDEVTITPVDPTYQPDRTLQDLQRERDLVMQVKVKADSESEAFVKQKTTVTVGDILKQILGQLSNPFIGIPMLNTIMSAIVALIPGLFEYLSTNGFTWKSLLAGLAAGLLAYFSPSPKSTTPQV